MKEPKVCKDCGKTFIPINKSRIFCNDKCHMHYYNNNIRPPKPRHNGDHLDKSIWFSVPGYNGIYFINKQSDVWSVCYQKVMTQIMSDDGYFELSLKKDGKRKKQKIHRLIALTFIPNTEGKPQVNHINGIKSDNRIENLEWVTPAENTAHAYSTGLNRNYGKRHRSAKLDNDKVLKIKEMLSAGISHSKIQKEIGIVHKASITAISTGKTWTRVKPRIEHAFAVETGKKIFYQP